MRFPLILRTDKWYRYFMASLGTLTNLLRSKWSSSRKICLANRPSGRELNSLPPNFTTFRLVFSDHRADDMLVNPHLSISSLWRSTRGARLRLLAGFLARMLVTLLRLLPIMPRMFMYYFWIFFSFMYNYSLIRYHYRLLFFSPDEWIFEILWGIHEIIQFILNILRDKYLNKA